MPATSAGISAVCVGLALYFATASAVGWVAYVDLLISVAVSLVIARNMFAGRESRRVYVWVLVFALDLIVGASVAERFDHRQLGIGWVLAGLATVLAYPSPARRRS